jgi:hypothetical protein
VPLVDAMTRPRRGVAPAILEGLRRQPPIDSEAIEVHVLPPNDSHAGHGRLEKIPCRLRRADPPRSSPLKSESHVFDLATPSGQSSRPTVTLTYKPPSPSA